MKIRTFLMIFTGLSLLLSSCAVSQTFPAVEGPAVSGPAMGPGGQMAPTEQVAVMVTQTLPPNAQPTQPPKSTEAAMPDIGKTGQFDMPPAIEAPIMTYTNEKVGFSLDYPKEWELTDLPPAAMEGGMYTISLMSPVVRQPGKQSEGLPPGASKLDINITVSDPPATLDSAVAYWRQNVLGGDPPAKIINEQTGKLRSGIEGVRWQVAPSSGGEPVSMFITAINGHMINITGMGDLQLVNQIAGTLRVGK